MTLPDAFLAEPDDDPPSAGPVTPAVAGAAGVICWRRGRDGGRIEVLLVRDRDDPPGDPHPDRGIDARTDHHSERDRPWGWPQGRPEAGETLPECAARQAHRATGEVMTLARPLPDVRGTTAAGVPTRTVYWAAHHVHGRGRGAGSEIGLDHRWFPVAEAASRITEEEAVPLAALAAYAEAATLDTSTALIVRHATARPRDAWARADADRPLVASGRRQAIALGALLAAWRPDMILCSPWRRCLETMGPYAAASGSRLRTKGGLSEAGHRRDPDKAVQHVRKLLDSAHGGAVCTHRPVLAALFEVVRSRSTPQAAESIPRSSPFLRPAEVLVAHVVHRPGRRPLVVAVERHAPA